MVPNEERLVPSATRAANYIYDAVLLISPLNDPIPPGQDYGFNFFLPSATRKFRCWLDGLISKLSDVIKVVVFPINSFTSIFDYLFEEKP